MINSILENYEKSFAKNYLFLIFWLVSFGVDWWIMSNYTEISNACYFNDTTGDNPSKAYYKGNYGSDYYGHTVYVKIKTDKYTWNECYISGY